MKKKNVETLFLILTIVCLVLVYTYVITLSESTWIGVVANGLLSSVWNGDRGSFGVVALISVVVLFTIVITIKTQRLSTKQFKVALKVSNIMLIVCAIFALLIAVMLLSGLYPTRGGFLGGLGEFIILLCLFLGLGLFGFISIFLAIMINLVKDVQVDVENETLGIETQVEDEIEANEEIRKGKKLLQRISPLFLVLIIIFTFVDTMYILKLLGMDSLLLPTIIEEYGFSIGNSMLQILLILFVVTFVLISLFMLMKYLEISVKLIKRICLLFMIMAIGMVFLTIIEFISIFSKQGLNIFWITSGAQLFTLIRFGVITSILFSEYIVFSILARFVLSKEERDSERI